MVLVMTKAAKAALIDTPADGLSCQLVTRLTGAPSGRPFSLAPFSTHQNPKNSTDPLTLDLSKPIYVNVININILGGDAKCTG